MQAKLSNGQWLPGFTPGTSDGLVEGTSAQYTPSCPAGPAPPAHIGDHGPASSHGKQRVKRL
jgi:hypothetical protein